MTIRAVVIALLLTVLFCATCFFNDNLLRQTRMVGSYMPIALLGLLIILVLLVNPILGRIRRGFALTGRELAFLVAIGMMVAFVPGYGLMEHFTNVLIMPHRLALTNPQWEKEGVFKAIPEEMLTDIHSNPADVMGGYLQGKSTPSRHIDASEIPFGAWERPLKFWLPLLVTLAVAIIGLSLVIHQQWSANESLQYPIAKFAATLMPDSEGGVLGGVFRNKFFWMGLAGVWAIHMINYVRVWEPNFIAIPLSVDLRPLMELSRPLKMINQEWLFRPFVFFSAVGFAYFLASDLSFSVGIAPLLQAYVGGLCLIAGIDFTGAHMTGNMGEFLYAGAWAGLGLILIYTGRRYYFHTLRRAVFLGGDKTVKPFSVWGARVFLVAGALFVYLLARVGLYWPLAVAYTLVAVMIFVVMSRLVAETGTFFLHPWHFPCVTLLGFLGIESIGPKGLLIMMMISTVILINPRESLMPFAINALKVAELKGEKLGRTAIAGGAFLLVALAVAIPVTLYWQYDKGAYTTQDAWSTSFAPKFAINAWVGHKQSFEGLAGRAAQEGGTLSERLSHIRPNTRVLTGFGLMMGLVLLFSFMRMRFTWWPLHPVMFLVMGTWQAQLLAGSFLLGWLLKTVTVRLGGTKAYFAVRPLMVGLIAGEILAAVMQMTIGAITYACTNRIPAPHFILPG